MSIGIDLDGLRGFVAIADVGTFHEAAASLAVSQSALTRRIQKLEDSLGIALFERTTRRIALTNVGREFLPKAKRLITDLDLSLLSIRDIAERRMGRVTVACVPSVAYYFIPAALRSFNALFPQIRVRLIEDAANDVLQRVLDGEADLGVTFLGMAEEDIDFTAVTRDPFVLACRHDHPLAAQSTVRWADLSPYRFITAGRSSGNRLLLDRALGQSSWQPKAFYEVRHLPSSLGLVEAGLGIVALPRMSLPPEPHPTIVTRPLRDPEIVRTMGVVRRRRTGLAPAAQHLFDILCAQHDDASPSAGHSSD